MHRKERTMAQADRSRIIIATVLILVGVWYLIVQLYPPLQAWTLNGFTWPLAVVAVGAVLALIGLVTSTPEMLVPACILAGIGGLLYWQNATNNWESWAYAWTLIPGFVGVGVLLSGFLRGNVRGAVSGGGWLIFISLVLFLIFGSFFGRVSILGAYWPALLILFGLILLAQSLIRRR
jgi:hypothetical protein